MATYDEQHPQGAEPHTGGGEHHPVVPMKLLVGVIVALLVLTGVTVGAAYIDLGEPANIILAMAIATVKASLVAAFFMHLYWDKPINTIVLLFSLFLLALFLGMSMLDSFQYQPFLVPEYVEQGLEARRAEYASAQRANGAGGGTAGEEAPKSNGVPRAEREELAKWSDRTFGALPEVAEPTAYELTDAKVDLGRTLYYETRMSQAKDVSCNTCHLLDEFGVDGEATSVGHEGQRGEFNSPTVYNAALQTAQFWDARAKTVEEQALGPLTNPKEMAMGSHDEVVERLKAIEGYRPLFQAAFPDAEDPFTIENVGQAIGAFERKLITPSRFDKFMAGELDALTDEEVRGLQAYKEVNCQMCHMGTLLGGNMQQMLGLQADWPKEPGASEPHPDSKKMFKVPQLRNVNKTGPYLHDGSITDLAELVGMMAKYQLGADLSEAKVKAIVAFLGSLEGEIDEEFVAQPDMPE